MKDAFERLKKVPLPIWIGLGLAFIIVFVMSPKKAQNQGQQAGPVQYPAQAGPVTTATMGTQGAQVGAGTDQQLGNLSQVTQGGFAQLAQQDQSILSHLAGGMSGVGTGMTQMGSAMQNTQNASAQLNAIGGTTGQNTGAAPTAMSTVGHYTVNLPGGGNVTVNASDPQAAIDNVQQETGQVGTIAG